MYQFIVNPSAGTGKGYRIWKRLEKQLENEGDTGSGNDWNISWK